MREVPHMVTQESHPMQRARVDGAELEYVVHGTGYPVVFIHGSLLADAFAPLVAEPRLTTRFRLITYHRRGYRGSSHVPGSITLAQQAADCAALLRQLGVARAHVVGHSYGGSVALQLAGDYPGVAHSLTLLEATLPDGTSAQPARAGLLQGVQHFHDVGAATAVDEILRPRLGPGYRDFLDSVLPTAFADAVADAAATFEGELPGLLDWQFGPTEAAQVTQPALVVLGALSEALQPRYRERYQLLLEWLPRAEGLVLPGATHALQVQNPRGLAHGLADFLDRHSIPVGRAVALA
jgi:pimeloyl-ACP methyl ester carboxylesterase